MDMTPRTSVMLLRGAAAPGATRSSLKAQPQVPGKLLRF